jgi:DNA repair exonuclease SbcCD nuclease subunit
VRGDPVEEHLIEPMFPASHRGLEPGAVLVPVVKFLQISDLHLGAPFRWLPPARREERRREQQRALEDCVGQARSRGADAILVAGDLFDREAVDAEMLAFAVHAFDVTGCPPVFISPGNHDPYFPSSPHWSARLLAARGWAWPPHVHVFGGPGWTSRSLPGHPVRIWGRCFTSSAVSNERPLAAESLPPRSEFGAASLEIAVFHGSLEGRCPPSQTTTAPFSEDEAMEAPFTYMAVGHYHAATRLDDRGAGSLAAGVRLAYAGSALALEASEGGVHGALEVRIELGAGKPAIEVEPIALDPRRMRELSVDVTGTAGAAQIDRRIAVALDEARVAVEDVAVVRLTGRLTRGVRFSGAGADLDGRVFHLRLDLRALRPDYDLEALRRTTGGTTEERFSRALLERLDRETDPAERATIESALYYGLDAFHLRDVAPAYEDLAE